MQLFNKEVKGIKKSYLTSCRHFADSKIKKRFNKKKSVDFLPDYIIISVWLLKL